MDMGKKEVNNTLCTGDTLPETRPPFLMARFGLIGAKGAFISFSAGISPP